MKKIDLWFRFILNIIHSLNVMFSSIIYKKIFGSSEKPVWWAHSWWAPHFLWLSGVKLEVEGLDNVDFNKPHFFVSNHQSFIDIPSVFMALPVRLYFVAKKEISKYPIVGVYMKTVEMIFLDRSNAARAAESLVQAGELIRSGKSVIAFPEGTRTKNGEIGEFKKRSFLIAKEAGVPIVPLKIEGAFNVWPPHTSVPSKGVVKVKIGKPVDVSSLTKENVVPFTKQIRQTVIDL